MRKISGLFCTTVLGLVLTGCASVVSLVSEGGLDQKMNVTSDPPGATVFLMGSVPLGITPLVDAKIERAKNTFLVVKKEGYDDQNILLKHRFNPWFWGNIICCWFYGSTTDAVSDSTIQLSPSQYHVLLTQKTISLEQTDQFAQIKIARNLTLRGYSEVQQNLAVGGGEYLVSLLTTLRVPESEQGDAIRQLQELTLDSKDPLEFSDKVLDNFHLSRLKVNARKAAAEQGLVPSALGGSRENQPTPLPHGRGTTCITKPLLYPLSCPDTLPQASLATSPLPPHCAAKIIQVSLNIPTNGSTHSLS